MEIVLSKMLHCPAAVHCSELSVDTFYHLTDPLVSQCYKRERENKTALITIQ